MTTPRVLIIDYGLGNIFSIQQACQQAGLSPIVSASPGDLHHADGIILPGVGAFGRAMERLTTLELVGPLRKAAQDGIPLMGICLGMQLLFDESEEFGRHAGLGLLPGRICRLPDQAKKSDQLRIPNVGWSRIQHAHQRTESDLLDGIGNEAHMYFVHSFYATPEQDEDWLLKTQYGEICYCCATQRGSILGVQFHPEKSGETGLHLYKNWARTL